MPEAKAKGLIGMYPLVKGKGMGCGRVMSVLYSVGVVSRGPLGPGQFKYNYYPLMQFILAFAFSFRIQSFIWCYVEGLSEQICSPAQML